MPELTSDTKTELNPELEAMFQAGVHFAYRKTRRHPKMRPYIAGVRSNIEIFHLERVHEQLKAAISFLEELGREKKLVLWVGTKPAAERFIVNVGKSLGHPYVHLRWLGGTLTNFKAIRSRVNHMEEIERKRDQGELEKYRKHERMHILADLEKLDLQFGSLRSLTRIPDAIVVVDSNEEETAVSEARKIGVSTIGIMNSDCDPQLVTYAIPSNDNAPQSIEYLLQQLMNAYQIGVESRPKVEVAETIKTE